MRIITASTAEAATAFIPHSSHLSPKASEQHHLACSLFSITQLNTDTSAIALQLHWRHPDTPFLIRGALGCVVDYAARLAAQPYIGHSTLSECELHVGEPLTGNTLEVTARIDGIMGDCTTYECEVYIENGQRRLLVAHSVGTLLADDQRLSDSALGAHAL